MARSEYASIVVKRHQRFQFGKAVVMGEEPIRIATKDHVSVVVGGCYQSYQLLSCAPFGGTRDGGKGGGGELFK